MTSTHKDADTRSRFRYFLALGVREALLIMTIVLSVYLFMALSSYSPLDPGWASTGDGGPVRNYAGKIGAWFSSLLIYFFGQVSYLFPMIVAVQSWRMFRKRHEPPVFNWPLFALRAAGVVVVIMTTTALLAIYSVGGWDKQSGGILGAELAQSALAAFNLSGSTLILTAFNLVGITLATGLSWLKLMDSLGYYALRGVGALRACSVSGYTRLRNTLETKSVQRAERKRQKQLELLNEPSNEKPEKALPESGNARLPVINRREPVVLAAEDEIETITPIEPTVDVPGEPESSFKLLSNKVKAVARKAVPKTHKNAPGSDKGEPPETEADLPELTEQVSVVSGDSTPEANQKQIKISPFERKQADEKKAIKQKGLFDAGDTSLPAISLLDPPETNKKTGYSPEALTHMSRLLEEKLADFGVTVEVVEVNPGPVITRFEIRPAPGVKVSKISNLVKDLARSLAVFSVRVVEVIPGKSVVGIEIPNEEREMVKFSEVLSTSAYERSDSPLTLALGNDIAGDPVVVNLAKMPHLLVAGTTGSGKSVGVNAMLLSMLFKARPDELRLIMVDPKMLELSIYDGIPHLLTPVVTDMKEAANALRWCVAEMERRYRLMAAMGVRNLAGFNSKVKAAREAGEPLLDPLWSPDQHLDNTEQARPELDTLPFIVVVIDEFADMMMIVGKKVEELIARIAQKARAAGIHLILATQRPSVDVITGLIKANVPTRISFQVSSKIDSRTILDQGGAEQLLGHGDMLYLPPGSGMPERVHGAFVSDDEVHRVVSDWKLRGEPDYLEDVLSGGDSSDPMVAHFSEDGTGGDSEQDALYDQAVEFVTETRRASISAVQRKLKIGYNRAANLVEAMEAAGVVSEAGHNGAREVLAPAPPRD